MKGKVHILLVDDHAFVRRALKRLLEVDPALRVCAEAEDGAAALQALRRHQPDVIVLDLALKHEDGLALTRTIRARCPTPILILSIHKETMFAEGALRAGANGYLMKNDAPEHLIEAVHELAKNRIYVSDMIRQSIYAKMRTDSLARQGAHLHEISAHARPLHPSTRAAL